MSFRQLFNKYIPIEDIEKDLDEIERYLEDKSVDINQSIKKFSEKKPSIKKTKKKNKVDTDWMIKTASKNFKMAVRKWSRHM